MRIAPAVAFLLAACFAAGCALAQLTQSLSSDSDAPTDTAPTDGGTEAAAVDAGVRGTGCGIESGSGAQLCIATSLCPTVVVDTQALPHCGFRIKAGSSELVCGCGESICSMGTFTTCAEAAQLLLTQTEPAVCSQIVEARCTTTRPAPSSGGRSGASSSGGSTCDRTCLQECGGGAGCASICGC